MEQRAAERLANWYGAIFFFIVVPIASFLLVMAYLASMPAYGMTNSYPRDSPIYATPLIPVGVVEAFAIIVVGLSIVEGIYLLKRAAFARTASHLFAVFVIAAGVYSYILFQQYSLLPFAVSGVVTVLFGLFGIYLFGFNKSVKALFQRNNAPDAAKPSNTPPSEPRKA